MLNPCWHLSGTMKRNYKHPYNHTVVFLGSGFGLQPPIAQTRTHDVTETLP